MKGFLYLIIISILFFSSGYLLREYIAGKAKTSQSDVVAEESYVDDNSLVDNIINPSASPTSKPTPVYKTPKYIVPIFMYHYIRDWTDPNDQLGISLSVSPDSFDRQLKSLKDAGYETISLTDYVNGKIKPKSVVLTFDDGYDDHYTAAYPILKKYGFTGTFFIIGNKVGTGYYMTQDQIDEMKANGMEIGGHTMDHINLATASYSKAYSEISQNMIGKDSVFAYPSGYFSDTALHVLAELNIKAAVTTMDGLATDYCSKYLITRLRVSNHTDLILKINDEKNKKLVCSPAK